MARYPARQVNSVYVSGNLARELERPARERREYIRPPAPRKRVAAQPKHRERVRVSNAVVLGFLAAAAAAIMLLTGYAQLSTLSNQVVRQQRTLASLQEERVKLIARYEKTFDLAAVKEAAEQAGMAKPSASQIYYIDLSAPDNVVLYARAGESVLRRAAASVGQDVASIVEYFK